MKYFTNCHSLEDLKAEYRRLVKIHHPDMGGSTETMQAINDEHDRVFEILKKQHNATAEEHKRTTEAPEEFINIINALVKIPGIIVELCGCWLWISGDTRASKDALKAAGCRWSSSKKMWYWRHQEDGAHWSRGKKTMGQIRAKYGSQTFAGSNGSSAYALEA